MLFPRSDEATIYFRPANYLKSAIFFPSIPQHVAYPQRQRRRPQHQQRHASLAYSFTTLPGPNAGDALPKTITTWRGPLATTSTSTANPTQHLKTRYPTFLCPRPPCLLPPPPPNTDTTDPLDATYRPSQSMQPQRDSLSLPRPIVRRPSLLLLRSRDRRCLSPWMRTTCSHRPFRLLSRLRPLVDRQRRVRQRHIQPGRTTTTTTGIFLPLPLLILNHSYLHLRLYPCAHP